MGCGCGGSNRQVVPRREQARQQGPVERGAHRLNGNGTVWNGPDQAAAPVPSEVVAASEPQPSEA
jgi:hypothetical protein